MFFADKAKDQAFLNQLKQRSTDAGCYNLRIMVDGEGVLGDLNTAARTKDSKYLDDYAGTLATKKLIELCNS